MVTDWSCVDISVGLGKESSMVMYCCIICHPDFSVLRQQQSRSQEFISNKGKSGCSTMTETQLKVFRYLWETQMTELQPEASLTFLPPGLGYLESRCQLGLPDWTTYIVLSMWLRLPTGQWQASKKE